jgi:hypothetical protein
MKRIAFLWVIVSLLISCNKEDTTNYVDQVLPPPVENFRSGIYDSQFTLFWDYGYQSQINYYVLEYSPGNHRDTIGAYESYYQIPDYQSDTSYFFLIRVVDKKGNYSEGKTLRVEN